MCTRVAFALGQQPVEYRIQRSLTNRYHISVHV